MAEKVLFRAAFNPAVKSYWMLSLLLFSTFSIVGIPLLIITVPIFMFLAGKVLAAISATLTERKLIVKRGVFVRVEKTIPLDKITDVALTQGPIMRLFHIHTLSFETAGQSGQGALVTLTGVVKAEAFREMILEQKEMISAGSAVQKAGAENRAEMTTAHDESEIATLTHSVQRIEALLAQLVAQKKAGQ